MLKFFLPSIVASLLIAFVLPRKIAFVLGLTALFLGIIVPLSLWGYAELFVLGDKSTQGMLGTICALLFAPSGVLITLFSFFKND
jgi:hypothetical protein